VSARNGHAVAKSAPKRAPAKKTPGRSTSSTAKLMERLDKLEADNKQLTWLLAGLLHEVQLNKARAMAKVMQPRIEAALMARMNGQQE
jgi:hypothetical protein